MKVKQAVIAVALKTVWNVLRLIQVDVNELYAVGISIIGDPHELQRKSVMYERM